MSTNQTAVVTGGNRGIGSAVAAELVRRGCRVVVVVRDRERGERTVAELGDGAEFVVGDLSVLADVRSIAARLLDRCERIDLLVHNAGLWPTQRVRTPDGFEQSFAVNHLAPFLLNHLLAERLGASRTRVVQVSAGLYIKGRVDPDRTPTGMDFHRMRTYCDTKLANLMMVRLFAERWRDTGATIGAVHPGVINTGLGDPGGVLGLVLRLVKRFWATPVEGAEPVVRLAFDTEDPAGGYFDRHTPDRLHPVADDPELARRLWTQAGEFTGIPVVP
jgi:NAD(P)-dependent dehydrogenase (short-subunit alcohol dehydrogenase family)